MLHPFAAYSGFLLPTPEHVCIFFVTYEHPLYRFIFLHRGRFVYCPFLLVRSKPLRTLLVLADFIHARIANQRAKNYNHGIIERWERIYLEEGAEGLAIERRGRKRGGQLTKLPKAAEEDLIAENQRLRAENEYLKNLQALVLEEERRRHRKRR